MNLNDLCKPFPVGAIHWRIGSTNVKKIRRESGDQSARATKGIPLAYIDARDAYNRLDDVCGMEGWQDRYPFEGCCEIGIKIGGEWIWKANGAGATDIEGVKGQYSDAFKRAAVLWGIGRYLYDIPNTWVDLKEWGKFEAPKLPQWATPAGWSRLPKSEKDEVYKQTLAALGNGDENGLREIWASYDSDAKVALWPMFNSAERSAIKELMKT